MESNESKKTWTLRETIHAMDLNLQEVAEQQRSLAQTGGYRDGKFNVRPEGIGAQNECSRLRTKLRLEADHWKAQRTYYRRMGDAWPTAMDAPLDVAIGAHYSGKAPEAARDFKRASAADDSIREPGDDE